MAIPTKALYVEINADLRIRLNEYSERTGRSFRFVVENGIAVAIDTDCRYGGEIPLVALVLRGGVYKVPQAVAEAYEAQECARIEAEQQLSNTTNQTEESDAGRTENLR